MALVGVGYVHQQLLATDSVNVRVTVAHPDYGSFLLDWKTDFIPYLLPGEYFVFWHYPAEMDIFSIPGPVQLFLGWGTDRGMVRPVVYDGNQGIELEKNDYSAFIVATNMEGWNLTFSDGTKAAINVKQELQLQNSSGIVPVRFRESLRAISAPPFREQEWTYTSDTTTPVTRSILFGHQYFIGKMNSVAAGQMNETALRMTEENECGESTMEGEYVMNRLTSTSRWGISTWVWMILEEESPTSFCGRHWERSIRPDDEIDRGIRAIYLPLGPELSLAG